MVSHSLIPFGVRAQLRPWRAALPQSAPCHLDGDGEALENILLRLKSLT